MMHEKIEKFLKDIGNFECDYIQENFDAGDREYLDNWIANFTKYHIPSPSELNQFSVFFERCAKNNLHVVGNWI